METTADNPPVASGREPQPTATAPSTVPEPPGLLLLPSDHYSYAQSGERIFSELAKTRTLFTRGGTVVELRETNHGPELSLLRPPGLQSRLDRDGQLVMAHVVIDGKVCLKPKRCPRQTAEVLLESREADELLPPIVSVTAAPVLILGADGEPRVLGPGYNPEAGGILVTGGAVPPNVPLDQAVSDLKNLLRDFDFQTPGDQSRAVAMVVTPALKLGGFLASPAPIDVAEADQSQSGKTYRQTITRAIYRERGYAVIRRDGGVGSLDESIGSALLSGRSFVIADNLRGRLDSQYLEAVITWPDAVSVRVPHRGEVTVNTRHVTFSITSNGVETTRDLANRSCFVRIRKRPPGHPWYPWLEGSLHTHVEANQAHYLGCVHAVIRHWVKQGQPRTSESRHDMREWAGALDWIVQEIFGCAPLLDGHLEAQERVSNPALVWLRAVGLAAAQDGLLDRPLTASELWQITQDHDIPLPGARGALDDKAAAQHVGRLLGPCFRNATGNELVVDGLGFLRSEHLERDDEKRCTRNVKRYTLTRNARCP